MKEIHDGISFLKRNDAIMSQIMLDAREIPDIKKRRNPFQALCKSIIYQQLATNAARTIYKRFLSLYNDKHPTPEQLLRTRAPSLRKCGLSKQKIEYLKDLSRKVLDGTVEISRMGKLPDEKIIEELVKVNGIGKWTVEMFLIFHLGRLDVFSPGDLAIKNTMKKLYNLDENVSSRQLEEFAERWRPYRSIACWYLWHHKDNGNK